MDNKAAIQRYRRLAEICNTLWNEFDPIGVVENIEEMREAGLETGDEYTAYVPQTVKLVMTGANEDQLRSYIQDLWEELTASKPPPSEVEAFVKKLAALAEAEAKPCAPR